MSEPPKEERPDEAETHAEPNSLCAWLFYRSAILQTIPSQSDRILALCAVVVARQQRGGGR